MIEIHVYVISKPRVPLAGILDQRVIPIGDSFLQIKLQVLWRIGIASRLVCHFLVRLGFSFVYNS